MSRKGQFKKGVAPAPHKDSCKCFRCGGKPFSLKGIKWSKEALENRRKGIANHYKNGGISPILGRKANPETIEKKRTWAKQNKDVLRRNGIKGYLAQNRTKNPTSIEKIVYQKLLDLGIIFEKQYVINDKFVVDVYIPDYNLIIEVDGSYWHSLDRIMKKDKAENAYLKKCGYRVVRIPEKQVADCSMSSLIEKFMAGRERD